VFQYLAITHLGGAGVWIALLLLVGQGALGDPAALQAAGGGMQAVVALTALIGFGTKAGIMPFHSWLPRAHPLAPSHVSALMSGMMIKVALYGLIRVLFEWLGATPVWLAVLVLALGTLSAVGGVVYALFQHELKRLLAFHSIENVGIIVLGLGASLMFQARGQTDWAALAFAAALLHVLNHAVFKGLLFLGAGSFDRAVHGLDLDHLGGLLRRMPWTGGAFLVGSMAIAGLPPLNGFASEWLTLQALIHVTTGAAPTGASLSPLGAFGMGSALVGFAATIGLAITAALAVLCFAKVVGLVLLGQPRRQACAEAREVPRAMIAGTTMLAVFCVVLGLLPGLLVPRLMLLAPTADGSSFGGLYDGSALRLEVPFPGSGGLPTLGVGLVLALFVVVLVAVRGSQRAAVAPVWACGQRVEPALRWTSAGFTKSLRLTLESALRVERAVDVEEKGGVVQAVTYHGAVPHLFDTLLYGPVVRGALGLATFARRLQSGSLRTYVLYFLALIVLLLVVGRIWVAP
jgi:hydrogenase-4 component B